MSKKDDDNEFHKDSSKLIELVQDYCTSKNFEGIFENFAKENASIFLKHMKEIEKSDEHPLELHDVYREYLKMFEGLIEDFIRKIGYTSGDFFDACKDILDNDAVFGTKRFFIETMMAASEYTNFFLLMRSETRQYAEENNNQTSNHK